MQGSKGILSRGILSLLIFGNHKIWGILSEVILSWGILSQGNFFLEDFVMGNYVVGDFVKGGFCHGGFCHVTNHRFPPTSMRNCNKIALLREKKKVETVLIKINDI